MSVGVRVGDGTTGETVAFDGEMLDLLLTHAFAPGAPLVIDVVAPGATLRVEGKSRGSKKQPDGRFAVRVRTTSLRREVREALSALHPR